MRVISCDHPGCQSYYQLHPKSHSDMKLAMRKTGWQVVEVSADSLVYFCQAHKIPEGDSIASKDGEKN